MSDIRLVALGPPGVGKTSIIKRFLFNTFTDKYKPTIEDLFSKEFSLNGVKIKVDILDTAGRVEFPAMRRLSIANAGAFLFVYSLESVVESTSSGGRVGSAGGAKQSSSTFSTCSSSSSSSTSSSKIDNFAEVKECFAEVKGIRGAGGLNNVPIVFAGNKMDLVCRNELSVSHIGRRSAGSTGDLSTHATTTEHSGFEFGFTVDWIDGIEDLHVSCITCSAKTNTNIQQVFTSFLHLYKQINEVTTSSFKRRSSSKSSKNSLQTEEPKSRRSRSLIRRSSRKVKQQVEFIEPECRLA